MSCAPFQTEAALHVAVSSFLADNDWPHVNQPQVGSGKGDILLELPDGRPSALIEIKNGLTTDISLADAADYFEQAAKYRLASELPVFIGPFFDQSPGVVANHLSGGPKPKTIAALSAFGGRMDVGLFFIHCITGYEGGPSGWYGFQLLLRQQRHVVFMKPGPDACMSNIFPTEPIPTVLLASSGSRRDRVAL